ncbi:hypothetical protein, partial [Dyella sp.]|uniref:hypothetical protein n=1 Tax=Dyella sp. TaxID=1869338 RepID=UPI002ED27071
ALVSTATTIGTAKGVHCWFMAATNARDGVHGDPWLDEANWKIQASTNYRAACREMATPACYEAVARI